MVVAEDSYCQVFADCVVDHSSWETATTLKGMVLSVLNFLDSFYNRLIATVLTGASLGLGKHIITLSARQISAYLKVSEFWAS